MELSSLIVDEHEFSDRETANRSTSPFSQFFPKDILAFNGVLPLGEFDENSADRCSSSASLSLTPSKVHSFPKVDIESKKEAGENFKCGICSHTAPDRKSFMVHKRVHTGEKHFRCTQCSASFTRLYRLNQHSLEKHDKCMSRGHGSVKHCPYPSCAFSTRNPTVFGVHKNNHQKSVPCFFCKQCESVRYAQRRSLIRHLQREHDGEMAFYGHDLAAAVGRGPKKKAVSTACQSMDNRATIDDTIDDSASASTYKDPLLSQSTAAGDPLQSDDELFEELPPRGKGKVTEQFRCDRCSYASTSFKSVYAHRLRKHASGGKKNEPAKIGCFYCRRKFGTNEKLLVHVRTMHEGTSAGQQKRKVIVKRRKLHAATRQSVVERDRASTPAQPLKLLPKPMAQSPNGNDFLFRCTACAFTSSIEASLQIHVEQAHRASEGNEPPSTESTSAEYSQLGAAKKTHAVMPQQQSKFGASVLPSGASPQLLLRTPRAGEQATAFVQIPISMFGIGGEAPTGTDELEGCIEHLGKANARLLELCKRKDSELRELRSNVAQLVRVLCPNLPPNSLLAGNGGSVLLPLDRVDAEVRNLLESALAQRTPTGTSEHMQ